MWSVEHKNMLFPDEFDRNLYKTCELVFFWFIWMYSWTWNYL